MGQNRLDNATGCNNNPATNHQETAIVYRPRFASVVLAVALAASPALGSGPAAAQSVKDILGVPGPIKFDGTDYLLAWSAKPSKAYAKHEYLPQGQKPETYRAMILLEFLEGAQKPMDLAKTQIENLNARKASDPLVNMSVIQNPETGEVILDFILSAKDARGEYIVEWNGYRYARAQTRSGKSGGVLFGISHRAYGNEAARAFLTGLAQFKAAQIKTLAGMPLPKL